MLKMGWEMKDDVHGVSSLATAGSNVSQLGKVLDFALFAHKH